MRILHICNDFCGSKVHANLYKRLDNLNVEQTIFTYYRDTGKEGKNQFEGQHTSFIYKGILRIWHRLFYHLKIKKVYSELKKDVVPLDYDLIHATTLFSDGAIAYKLYRNYNIPYVVAVRSTDVNEFLKIAPHTWRMGMKILRNARRIIFITPVLQSKLCKHIFISRIASEISAKFIIQPNGIDDFWLNNIYTGWPREKCSVVYVGSFIRRKNVEKLIAAILRLRHFFPKIKLHIVGDGGSRSDTVLALIHNHPDCLIYHGKIIDKAQLRDLYRKCRIFAMPSVRETFGLVYIEALTQNLQLLYTQNDGIDGLLEQTVGVAIDGRSQRSIEDGLRKLLEQQTPRQFADMVDFEQFRWKNIAERYRRMYEEV